MEQSTSTSVELCHIQAIHPQQSSLEGENVPPDTDPVLQVSRVHDSSVPDGGYGWVVVGGCAVVSWWMFSPPYSWGIIQAALIDRGVSTPAVLSFVGSLAASIISALAIVNSRVMRVLGPQKTGMLGIFLTGLSEFVSSFTFTNVGALFATSGVLMGLGISLCFTTISVAPAQYFSRKRGLANGIVFAGGGLGGAVMSFALDALLQNLGPGWAFRALALMTLVTGLPAAYLIKERVPYRSSGFIEWRLFKSLTFVVIFLAGAIATFPLFVPPFFIPLYAKSIGLSSSTGAGLVAAFSFSSAVGRVCCGILCDKLGALNVLLVSLLLTGVSMLALWPVSTTLAPMIAFVIFNGISNGGFFSTMPTVVGNIFGSARVSVAMGMIVTGWAGGYLMGAPIAGYILEAYGGAGNGLRAYRPAMYYAGSLAMAATGLVALCDEQGPPCANCIAREVPDNCTYSTALVTPTPEVSSGETQKPGFISDSKRRLELELMHRWSTTTYRCLCSMPQDYHWLQFHAPRWAFKQDFLLHGIFSLSALEIAICDEPVIESDPAIYVKVALEYYDQASRSYRAELRNITPENVHCLWVFSSIALAVNMAIIQCEHLMGDYEPQNILARTTALLELLRGSSSIALSHLDILMKGEAGPSIQQVVESIQTPPSTPLPDTIVEVLERLDVVVEKAVHVSGVNHMLVAPEAALNRAKSYEAPVEALRICLVEDFKDKVKGVCISFPSLAGPDFAIALKKAEPVALFLLMHWGVLLDRLGKLAWWAKSIGKAMVSELSENLSRQSSNPDLAMIPTDEWQDGIAWARREVGLPVFSDISESASSIYSS
ncbi:Fc.00g057220.m01.CDS01 [Cosmosporella sp. VM-42]